MATKYISPGVYEISGKRINAKTKAEAEKIYQQKYAPKPATKPAPTTKPGGNNAPPPTKPAPTTAQPKYDSVEEQIKHLEDNIKKYGANNRPNDVKRLEALKKQVAGQTPETTPETSTPTTTPPIPTEPPPPGVAPGGSPLTDTIDPNTPGLSTDDAGIIARMKALLGIGEEFGRGIANEFYSDGSLGRVKEELTPDEVASLEAVKRFAAEAGVQSQDIDALINSQRGILDSAQQYSTLEDEALGKAREALLGMSAPEMQGLRSQARDNIEGQAQQLARQMAKSQARNQVFGASALAQNRLLGQDKIRATRDLERDLLVKDIDIKAAARNQFTNLVSQTEGQRASRTNAASGQLSNTLLTDENQRKSAQNAANANYSATSASLGDRLRQLQEYNLGQAAAEKAGQVGSIFGGIGTITDQRGLLAGEEFANQQLAESQNIQEAIMQLIKDSLKKQTAALA